MSRYYALGIVFLLLALNIPEVTGDMRARVTFYTPIIAGRIQSARDIVEPAVISLIDTYSSSNTLDTTNTWKLNHAPSISAHQFDSVLTDYNSPAAGLGVPVTQYAEEREIDTAYVLYMFIHESTAGTNKAWAGIKADGSTTHNPGNIICAGYPDCYNGFRNYVSWNEGFTALIDLLVAYRDIYGDTTIDAAIMRWAPPTENDTDTYINALHDNVSKWRAVNQGKFIALGEKGALVQWMPELPLGNTHVESIPLLLDGCLGTNVRAAYGSSPLLRSSVIRVGEEWSFNEAWNIDTKKGVPCNNIEYGGICDMAGRYSNAAHRLGLITQYTYHGFNLDNLPQEDSTAIWSDGTKGGQDLVIRNTTRDPVYLQASIENNVFIVTMKKK